MPYKKTKVGTGKTNQRANFCNSSDESDKGLTGRDEEKRLWKYFYDDENEQSW